MSRPHLGCFRYIRKGCVSLNEIAFEASAPSPAGDHTLIVLAVESERVRQIAKLGRKTPLFELLYNVCGILPPVNNIGYHEADLFPDHWGGMQHTHAIFKGLRRPMNNHGLDDRVYVYLLQPKYTYKYCADMVCVAKRFPAPAQSVFAVYVTFEDETDFTGGVIINWEWVLSDSDAPQYPKEFDNRYDQRIWTNG